MGRRKSPDLVLRAGEHQDADAAKRALYELVEALARQQAWADYENAKAERAEGRSDKPIARPHTPEMLAERWGCSPNHVRNLIRRGELRAFRVGGLIRIPAEAVEECERLTIAPPRTGRSEVPQQKGSVDDGGIVIVHARERKRRPPPQ